MEQSSSSRNEANRHRFDSYCKKVLKNEAIDCYREIRKHRQREIFFSELSEKEWKQLYMEDSLIGAYAPCTLKTEYCFAYRT